VTQRIAPPKAVLFDWDNTLVDTWETIHASLCTTFEAMGEPVWTLAETRARVRHSLRRSFPEIFGDRWQEAARIYFRAFEDIHLDRLAALPGAGEMLDALSSAGIYLAVVSNKTGRYLRMEAEHLGWRRFFGRLVGAGDALRDKPATEPVELALSGSDVSAIDMELAHNARCLPVLLRAEDPSPGELDAFPPAVHLRNCGDLVDFAFRQ
jgi:phosphoglycolate phosphatase